MTLAFLDLLEAPYTSIYDISSLRVNISYCVTHNNSKQCMCGHSSVYVVLTLWVNKL